VSNNATTKERENKRTHHPISSGSDWEDLDDRVSRRNERAAAPRSAPGMSLIVAGTEKTRLILTGTPKAREEATDVQDFADCGRFYRASHNSNVQTPTKTSNYLLDCSINDSDMDGGLKRTGFFKGLFQKKSRTVYGVDRKFHIVFPLL
jgi:hypothetical protein